MDAQSSERGSAQFGTSFSTPSGASEARCQRGQMPIEPDVPTSKEPLSPMPLSPLQLSSTEPNITSEPSPCRHNACVPMETMTKAFSAGPFSPRAFSPARNTGAAVYTPFRLTRPASVIRASEQTQHAIQPVTPLTISNGKSLRGGAMMKVIDGDACMDQVRGTTKVTVWTCVNRPKQIIQQIQRGPPTDPNKS